MAQSIRTDQPKKHRISSELYRTLIEVIEPSGAELDRGGRCEVQLAGIEELDEGICMAPR